MPITENTGLNYGQTEFDQPLIDENWNKIDVLLPLCVLEQLAVGSLPPTPSDGEIYITTDTLEIYKRQAGIWYTTPLQCGKLFYDVNLSGWYVFDGTTISSLASSAAQVKKSSPSGSLVLTGAFVDLANMDITVSLPSNNHAVIISFLGGQILIEDTGETPGIQFAGDAEFQITRGGSPVGNVAKLETYVGYSTSTLEIASLQVPTSVLSFYDAPGLAGSYQYKLQGRKTIPNLQNVAFENAIMVIQIVEEV